MKNMSADISSTNRVRRHMSGSPRGSRKLLLLTSVGCLMALRGASGIELSLQGPRAATTPETPVPKVVGFAPIGDVQMYYEVQGTGTPFCLFMVAEDPHTPRGPKNTQAIYRAISW